jgi:hypothetical protein
MNPKVNKYRAMFLLNMEHALREVKNSQGINFCGF